MKLIVLCVLITIAVTSAADQSEFHQYKSHTFDTHKLGLRHIRQADADEMVQNILQWLQTIYKENTRKTRQQNLVRGYLPPAANPERPRPFEMSTTPKPYRPNTGATGTVYQPAITTTQPNYPVASTSPPYQPSGPSTSGPSYQTSAPEQPRPYQPSSVQPSPDLSTPQIGYQPSGQSSTQSPTSPSYRPEPQPFPTSRPDEPKPFPTSRPDEPRPFPTTRPAPGPDDDTHPPHIHALDVNCAKDMMTINIEFNRPYDGIVYSKGFYDSPECRYVKENTGQTKYSFTVSLNSCGTEFINGFDTQGKSYLENVLVLQNEAGIQEVWDTIQSVRCLWEGNLNKALSVPLSVGMLNQEVVTFSGDTAMASLDIQQGRGPFAGPANGLVKIGDIMTLVVSVTGDPGFDVRVRDCLARDSTSKNVVMLTDKDGCVLKPKLFGAFQKTRQTQNTGASIIAYAYFSAFKFPDMMDLIMECNVELCKTDCEMCPRPDQKVDPGRRRRSISNETLAEPITVGRAIKVILPQDLGTGQTSDMSKEMCFSLSVLSAISGFVLLALIISSIIASYYWGKSRRTSNKY